MTDDLRQLARMANAGTLTQREQTWAGAILDLEYTTRLSGIVAERAEKAARGETVNLTERPHVRDLREIVRDEENAS